MNEEVKNKKENKVKKFIKDHWFDALLLGIGFGAGIVLMNERHRKDLANSIMAWEGRVMDSVKDMGNKLVTTPISAEIDKDIFTELAPTIEEAVLNSGVDKMVLERSYDLDTLTHKLVTVNIEQIYGD